MGRLSVVTNVLIDYHHADLVESLHLLFADRFGWEVYIPVGMRWWTENVWSFGRWTWADDRLARQFLTSDSVAVDDAHPRRVHRIVTFEEALGLEWDYVVASVPDNYAGYAHFAGQTGARFVIQVGNVNQPVAWDLKPLVLNSSEQELRGPGVSYHQEFSLADFHYSPAASSVIGSFVNCMDRMPCYYTLEQARALLPDRTFRIHGIDGPDGNIKPTAEVGRLMRSYGWGWHDKVTGDGFGHVIHNWAAVGRPLIGHGGHYWGQMAGPLWEDGVTCIDLDRHTVGELPALLEQDNARMGLAIRERFDELVNYDREAERIHALLTA